MKEKVREKRNTYEYTNHMLRKAARFAKKKPVFTTLSLLAVTTGTVVATQLPHRTEPTHYVMAEVSRGTLVTSVTGSGQVSAEDQFDVKSKVSGGIVQMHVKAGQSVEEGTPITDIDRSEASKTVRDAEQSVHDAELSLQSAELSYQKSQQGATSVQLLQAQNAVDQAQRNLDELKAGPDQDAVAQAEAELKLLKEKVALTDDGTPQVVRDAYDEGILSLKGISQTLEQTLYDADAVLGIDNVNLNDAFESVLSVLDSRRLSETIQYYQTAKASVAAFKASSDQLELYKSTPDEINANIDLARKAIQDSTVLLEGVRDVLVATIPTQGFSQSSLDGLRSNSRSNLSTVSSKLTTLISIEDSFDQAETTYENDLLSVSKSESALSDLQAGSDPNDIKNAEERLSEAQASLAALSEGPDSIDQAISQNSLAQRRSALQSARNRLADAMDALNDYTITAPFGGSIARVLVRPYDDVSPSTAIVTLMTDAKIAEINLNEVDVAKVDIGQNASLTFDALPDLTIAGKVVEIDPIGTASQGVVNFAVKVAFQTQDDRIKAGMNVSASIVTEVAADALLVPNAAVKTQGENTYVQTLTDVDTQSALSADGVTSAKGPQSVNVTTGLSNESSTVITDGLNEGDLVIIRTIEPSSDSTTKTTQTSGGGIGIPGAGMTGGGNFRFAR